MKITIGGNIGCGKTTLIQSLNTKLNVKPEPIEKWNEWLKLFYSDMKRFCFSFQMKILYDFLDYGDSFVSERSPLDALYVFAKSLLDIDVMSHVEYNLFSDLVHRIGWVPDIFIYIRVLPETCFERINQRDRDCENGVSLDYIRTLHMAYDRFVTDILKDEMNVTVHVIDASKSPDEVKSAVENILYTYINAK